MNNKDYWKNREARKRGQGESPIIETYNSELSKPASTRKRDRSKGEIDPKYTKKSAPIKTEEETRIIRNRVLKVEEIRHLYSLARKGLL